MYVTFTCLNFRFFSSFLELLLTTIRGTHMPVHQSLPAELDVPVCPAEISRPGPCSGGKDGSPDKVGSNVRDETDADDGTKRALRRESDARASGSSKRVRVYPHMHAAQPSSPSSSAPRPPLLRPPRRVPVPPLPPGYHPQLPLMAGEGKEREKSRLALVLLAYLLLHSTCQYCHWCNAYLSTPALCYAWLDKREREETVVLYCSAEQGVVQDLCQCMVHDRADRKSSAHKSDNASD